MNKLIQRLFEIIVLAVAIFCLFNQEAREFILRYAWWGIIGSIPILGGYEFLKYMATKSKKKIEKTEINDPIE